MFRSAVILSILSLASSLVSFVNQLLIASHFGATIHLDAYLIAISIPTLVMGLMAGLFSFSIVPLLVRRKMTDPDGYTRFSGLLFLFFLGFAFCISLISFIFAPILVDILVPTLPSALKAEAYMMARVAWIALGCSLVVNFLVAAQNSARKFVIPMIVNFFPYLGMIAAMVFWSHQFGVSTLVWGMMAGYLVGIPILYRGINKEFTFKNDISTFWSEVTPVLGRMPIVLVSMLCFTVYGTVDAFWASRLGPGNLSYLGYAQRLLITLGNLIVLGPGIVLTPYLSEQSATGEQIQFLNTVGQATRMIILFAAPVALALSLLGVPVIELLFQRGAFGPIATQGVASVLPGMMVGMVAMASVVLLFRALFASGDTTGAAFIGGIGGLLYFGLSGIFSKLMGLQGIVLAYASTWWILLCISILRLMGEEINKKSCSENMRYVGNLFVSLVVTGGLIFAAQKVFIRPVVEVGVISLAFRLGVSIGLGVGGFVWVSGPILRMPEMMALADLVPYRRWFAGSLTK